MQSTGIHWETWNIWHKFWVGGNGRRGIMNSWYSEIGHRKKWIWEATKGYLVVILECLQTLLTGAFLGSPPLSIPSCTSNQAFVLFLPLSPYVPSYTLLMVWDTQNDFHFYFPGPLKWSLNGMIYILLISLVHVMIYMPAG